MSRLLGLQACANRLGNVIFSFSICLPYIIVTFFLGNSFMCMWHLKSKSFFFFCNGDGTHNLLLARQELTPLSLKSKSLPIFYLLVQSIIEKQIFFTTFDNNDKSYLLKFFCFCLLYFEAVISVGCCISTLMKWFLYCYEMTVLGNIIAIIYMALTWLL